MMKAFRKCSHLEMETWFFIFVSLCISLAFKSLFTLLFPTKPRSKLPPGPYPLPVIGNLLWLRKPFFELGPIIRSLCPKYGPLITLHIGSKPTIFVVTHSLAHQALIQSGAAFASRPPATPSNHILSGNRHDISAAAYGSTWRVLRRNLASQILHSSLMKSYSHARRRALRILISKFKEKSSHGEAVHVADNFQSAMFHVLALMCFGDEVDENRVEELETVQRRLVLNFYRFNILSFWPMLGKILFRKRWNEFLQILRSQEDTFIPLIRARQEVIKQEMLSESKAEDKKTKKFVSYVDTLFNLHLPDEEKQLDEGDIVSLCSEFLNAGSDTISTTLVWIMANLVKHPHIQSKLFAEISEVVESSRKEEIKEEDLSKMPYLKAVILEGLRRHPPGHFVLPHYVTQDVTLDGCVIPKNATVNFLIAEMGRDPDVWEDPMAFKPERFINSGDGNGGEVVFDITGSKEIKMMPFGAGRRICPGYGLAMLHLEYFVANLVWYFEWRSVDGDDVDLSEKHEFMMVMKNPLKAQITKRVKSE